MAIRQRRNTVNIKWVMVYVLFSLVQGCASQDIAPQATQQFELLFSKQTITGYGTGCISVYHNQTDGLLYLVSKDRVTGSYVSVYDKRTGIFAKVYLTPSTTGDCDTIDLNRVKPSSYADLNYIEPATFRKLFDVAATNPGLLKEAINSGPPYFRYDGKYQGERSAVNVTSTKITQIKQLPDVAVYLKGLSLEAASQMVGHRVDQIKMAEQQINQLKQDRMLAKANWDARLSVKLGVGDKICTYKNNWFGYVDAMENNRIKMQVIGEATMLGSSTADGYFFSGLHGQFSYNKIESIRWLERDEVAPCSFE